MSKEFQPSLENLYAVMCYEAMVRRVLATHWRARGMEPLSVRETVVLIALKIEPRLVTALAEVLNITQQATGKILRKLEGLGFVEGRKPEVGKGDRREHPYYITKAGLKLVGTLKDGHLTKLPAVIDES